MSFVLVCRTSFGISCKLGLVVMNSLNLCLSGNISIFLVSIFVFCELFIIIFFFCEHFKNIILLPPVLPVFFAEKYADFLGVSRVHSLYIMSLFSLIAFKIHFFPF